MLRVFNTIVVLIGIGLFGVFDFTKDRLLGGLNTYDICLVSINFVFVVLLHKRTVKAFVRTAPFKYLYYIYLYILFIMLTMPLRGEISIIDSIRVGRNFLLFPFAVLIWYDIVKNGALVYYKNLIFFIAILTSIQILITAVNPEIISAIFPHIRAREFYKYGLQRNDFIANTMLFPHLATLMIFQKIVKTKFSKNAFLLFFLFYSASALQGFRSYFLVLSLLMFVVVFVNFKHSKIRKYALASLLCLPLIFVGDAYLLNSQISNKFVTSSMDINRDEGSSLKGRFERDLVYTIPMFLKKPAFGWGFIYPESTYGKDLGIDMGEKGEYSPYVMYTVDSGYLTLLNYFGIVGLFLIFYFFFKFLHHLYKMRALNYSLATIGFAVILILTLLTHGGLYSDFGLLPLLLITGLFLGTAYKMKFAWKVKKMNGMKNHI